MSEAGRILFVDDEPRVLEGIENLLFDAPEDWDIAFAHNGGEALDLLATRPFDVLITDMRMPGMDGAELLRQARKAFPSVVRVVLSGHTEQKAAQQAMPLAHEFLSKPCHFDALIATIQRALRLSKRFTDKALQHALGTVDSLPARPKVHQRLCQLIEGEASIHEVAALIASELAICARVMHVANTAFYARGRAVRDVHDAVSLLGLKTTSAIALAVETFAKLRVSTYFDVDALHTHSDLVGQLAAQLVPQEDAPEAMLGGLLHDIGSLLIAVYFPDKGKRAQRQAERDKLDLAVAETHTLGFAHTDIGGYLLRLWHLNEDMATAVEQHHSVGIEARTTVSLAIFAADYYLHSDTNVADWTGLTEQEQAAVTKVAALHEAVT
ncbi:MAG: HDOD domain-containing protein [Polyangiales bacterium]